ncbi:MAG: condensation domain-containing protein [Clostridiales bacterium]
MNVIPIRVKTYIQKSFVSLIKELHNCSLESEKYSYEAIDSAIFYENYPIEESIKHLYDSDESRFSNIKFYDQLHTSLNLFVIPFETTAIKLTYNSLCFDDRTIENIADNIIYIIDQLLDNINNIDEIKII